MDARRQLLQRLYVVCTHPLGPPEGYELDRDEFVALALDDLDYDVALLPVVDVDQQAVVAAVEWIRVSRKRAASDASDRESKQQKVEKTLSPEAAPGAAMDDTSVLPPALEPLEAADTVAEPAVEPVAERDIESTAEPVAPEAELAAEAAAPDAAAQLPATPPPTTAALVLLSPQPEASETSKPPSAEPAPSMAPAALQQLPTPLDPLALSESLVCLAPDQYPSLVLPKLEVSPLAELYYLTQTLPLLKLLPGLQKVLTLATYEKALLEGKIAVVYLRIEELKRMLRWSLRQPERFKDPLVFPPRGTQDVDHKSHWDRVVQEAQWLACDVREERKLRIAACHMMAQAVQEFWEYGIECCIKRAPIRYLEPEEAKDGVDVAADTPVEAPLSTVDAEGDVQMTIPDATEETSESLPEASAAPSPASSSPLSSPEDTPAVDVLLLTKVDDEPDALSGSELILAPATLALAPASVPRQPSSSPFRLYLSFDELNRVSRTLVDALPVWEPMAAAPGNAYSRMPLTAVLRLLAPLDEGDDGWHKVYVKERLPDPAAPPPGPLRGLFGSGSRRAPVLRPPQPPALKYLVLRTPTIWLPQDDKFLLYYVQEYQYNWNVIAAHMLQRPTVLYAANLERRTPWQCFERYIQLNDKFQFTDMKGVYAAAAQRWLEAAHSAQASTKCRILPLGVGNDSVQRGHRRLRWASMFDAIRKTMRKRESAPRPLAARRYVDLGTPRGPVPTPLELAKLKHEREKAPSDPYAIQALARMAPPLQGQRPELPQATKTPAALPPGVVPRSANKAGAPQPAPGMRPGVKPGARPTTPNGTPYTAEQLQYLKQYQRQRQLLQQQGQQPPPMTPAQVIQRAQQAARQGASSPTPTGSPAGRGLPPQLALSSAQVKAIVSQIQQQNPHMNNDQIRKLAEQCISQINSSRMRAYMAASGGAGAGAGTGSASAGSSAGAAPVLPVVGALQPPSEGSG